jgi:dTDP-4-dehydrorhamnose reductase
MRHAPILLLGANGLLGRAFTEQFALRDLQAISLNRHTCDVTNADQLKIVLDHCKPRVLINCTGYTMVDLAEVQRVQAYQVNATGAANVARACSERHVRLVHFSTDFVFDGEAREPYLPMHAVRPLNVYGQSKLRGEELIQGIDPASWLIVRTSWLFGASGSCFPRTILDRVRAGKSLKIINDQIGSPTYAPDLAAATLDLIDKHVSGIHHVNNTGQGSWFDLAHAVLKQFNVSADLIPVTTEQYAALRLGSAHRPPFSVMSDDQLPRLLGRHLRPWQNTLPDFFAACADRGTHAPNTMPH